MDEVTRRKVTARLNRLEGQVSALRRMIEQDQYCVDVLLQISAAQGALGKIGQIVLGSHIRTCVTDAFEHGDRSRRQQTVEELMDVFGRYSRIGGS
jgi:DNA-binding FrmR family transcriptional regulator